MCLIIHPLTFISGLKFIETLENEELRNVYGTLLTLGITPKFFVDDYDAAMHSWMKVTFVPNDNNNSYVLMPRFTVDLVLYDNGYFSTNINNIRIKTSIHLDHLRQLYDTTIAEKLFSMIYCTDNIRRFYFTKDEKEILNRGCNSLLQGMIVGHYVHVVKNISLSDMFSTLVKERKTIQQMYDIMLSKIL